MDRGPSDATVYVHAVAISSCHEGFLASGGSMVTRGRTTSSPQWKLSLVYESLEKSPLQPLELSSLKVVIQDIFSDCAD